ncbi:uracil-DNA glycosylase family protein [Thalassolituus sp. LLYu03]|uniref:uracil-DNA glycosylase family protein n=1 Tax=Thalassolituus sp. LLYu03 TaxID=3421656 RepID=UPI003D2DD91A
MSTLISLLQDVSRCDLCASQLPLGPRPVVRIGHDARILIIGQAPGTRVHASGIPWDDASGKRLRQWLGVSDAVFYDTRHFAIMPMGFCYPGKGKSGDLPPRPECAPQWHERLMQHMPHLQLILLIGQYAQNYYLKAHGLTSGPLASLTERVRDPQAIPSPYFVLPHPSPRNQLWLAKNPWFEQDILPSLKRRVQHLLAQQAGHSGTEDNE